MFVALGFGILFYAAEQAQQGVLVSPLWLTATYLLHTIGELCLSPVGLSAMTKLAPARIAGLTMGVWFLARGRELSGRPSRELVRIDVAANLFGSVVAVAAAVVLALLVQPIKRMLARAD